MNAAAASAFEAAVAEHGPLVRRICTRILGDCAAGDDAAQEAFLRLWTMLLRGEKPRSSGPWLRRAAASAALDLLRHRKLLHETAWPDDDDDPERAAWSTPRAAPPDVQAESAEFTARLGAVVASLPAAQRAVFVMRHDAALPLAEVAALLGIATTTVKTHFARATWRLRAALHAFAPERPHP